MLASWRKASQLAQTADLASHASNFFKRRWNAFQERRKCTRLRAVLHGLADRDLKDIGISRSEIEYLSLNATDWRTDPRGHL